MDDMGKAMRMMQEVIAKAMQDRMKVIEEAMAEVGLAGGGDVYVEDLPMGGFEMKADGKVVVNTKLWKVPAGKRRPRDLPRRFTVYHAPAMHRG